MKAENYTERFYRKWTLISDLNTFRVQFKETDLQVYARPKEPCADLTGITRNLVIKYRTQIEKTIKHFPQFQHSLKPIPLKTEFEITRMMIRLSTGAGVGPMAGVAGAIAEFVGRELLAHTEELIIENGGDLFIYSRKDRVVLVYAGEISPFRDKIRLKLRGRATPFGICTSSRCIGHSLSFGNADAALIIARTAIIADVFATAVGNLVKSEANIEQAMEFAQKYPEIEGGLILIGDKLAAWGEIEFV